MKSRDERNGRPELRENDHNRLADAQSAIIELDRQQRRRLGDAASAELVGTVGCVAGSGRAA
jgi:hypothetical protein